jgi:hypothetical protein
MKALNVLSCLLALSFCANAVADDAARFDLIGPKVSVRITRGEKTLPIDEVPNLQVGDKIWVKADLPTTQSNHLLLIVAFLRGTTNEPPESWFTEIDTWDKKEREGTVITVPEGAEQAIMFIAPETGGDFKTLRSAVRGKPGLFIRSDSDLMEASFEQQRIHRYLEAMQKVDQNDQDAIKDHSAKLAATLSLKPNADCFKQSIAAQVNCLTQSSAPVLLNDGHGQGIAEALSSGPTSDFVNTASLTQTAGAGLYSAYVGTVVDLVHLVSLMRTAQYQYIPGLAFPDGETLNLKLNAPVSFVNPKSVIVIGLPPIQKAKLPPLHAHDDNEVACLLQPKMALLVEGAPLVFSTHYAHDLVLHLNRTSGAKDIPLAPDAFEGGLIVSDEAKHRALEGDTEEKKDVAKADPKGPMTVTGSIKGMWGFDSFDGPTLTLQQVPGKGWKVAGDVQIMAGQEDKFDLKGEGTACVEKIQIASDKGKDTDVKFAPKETDGKREKDTLALDVSLKKAEPGAYSLAIQQYGDAKTDKLPLRAYNAGISLDDVKIHAGDTTAVLTGEGLNNVASVEMGKQVFTPTPDGNDDKTLHLVSKSGASPDNGSDAKVTLKDGRTMTANINAESARPGLTLLSIHATPAQQAGSLPVVLGAKEDIPLNGKLTFVVQTKDVFPRTQSVEVATENEAVKTQLSISDNTLVLQDEHTAVARLDPLKAFGQSAFGKLQMRPVAEDGTTGSWTSLGTLVRTPQITSIQCASADAKTCSAQGSDFFLVQSFGADKDMSNAADVPTGFADASMDVPMPKDGGTMYVKLRDDPNAVATVKLPQPVTPPAPAESGAPATPTASDAAPAPVAPTPAPASTSTPASTSEPATTSTPASTSEPATTSTPASTSTPAPKQD